MALVGMEAGSHHAPAADAMAHVSDTASGSAPAHSVCNACDICNGPAMTLALHSATALLPVQNHIDPACERFASAESQRGHKPPIA